LFLVSAWSVENGVSLGQLATEAKSNEITAIPELIENIDVSGLCHSPELTPLCSGKLIYLKRRRGFLLPSSHFKI